MAGILPHDPLGELLEKTAVLDADGIHLAVLPAAEEEVILRHFPAGDVLGNDGITGAVLDGKGGGFFFQPGNAECCTRGFLFVGDQRAGLEPCPQGGNGGLYGLAHKCPIPPQFVVTAFAAKTARYSP